MRTPVVLVLLFAMAGFASVPAFPGADISEWETFSPSTLALTENPRDPGARAMYLFFRTRVDRERMVVHGAIKIFNDAGRDLGNVTLPDFATGIRARTVRPDGRVVELSGAEILEMMLVRMKKLELGLKRFAFPDVEAGSILEYIYEMPSETCLRAVFVWPLQQEVFCLESWIEIEESLLKPYNRTIIDTYGQASIRTTRDGGWIRHGGSNIPAMLDEDFAPPAAERSAFFLMYLGFPYIRGTSGLDTQSRSGKNLYIELFWTQFGEWYGEYFFGFMDGGKKLRKAARSILAGDTRPVAPARKIYDHVARTIRNDSFVTRFEEARTAGGEDQGRKSAESVNTVLRNGRGSSLEITLLCTALMRAAGIDAYPVAVRGRDDSFFRRTVLADQFDEYLLAVERSEGRQFLDPATPYCPYGRVAWQKQNADAMIFHPGGGQFIEIPKSKTEVNRISRSVEATLKGGALQGRLRIECEGNPDFMMKNRLDGVSDEERREVVAGLLDGLFDGVELVSHEMLNLRDHDKPLILIVEFTVPDYVTTTRTRLMFKPVIFGRGETGFFTSKTRELPIFFDYPVQIDDRAVFRIPEGFQPDQLPEAVDFDSRFGTYRLSLASGDGGELVCTRCFERNGTRYLPRHYPAIRKFYEVARTGDQTVAVLKAGEPGPP